MNKQDTEAKADLERKIFALEEKLVTLNSRRIVIENKHHAEVYAISEEKDKLNNQIVSLRNQWEEIIKRNMEQSK